MSQSTPTADVLDDLCTRFILNVPAEELQCAYLPPRPSQKTFASHPPLDSYRITFRRSVEKLMFLVEQAHWFYEVQAFLLSLECIACTCLTPQGHKLGHRLSGYAV